MTMGNVIVLSVRGRPPGPLAHALDATANALDNERWDRQETALEGMVYRLCMAIATDGDADQHSRNRAGMALRLLDWNIARDERENARHGRQTESLRALNGLLDGKEEPAVSPAG